MTGVITTVYFVRHADSPYSAERERERGLSAAGEEAARRAALLLEDEGIGFLVSSPYRRAVLTLQPLADRLGLPVAEEEDLRERKLSAEPLFPSREAFFEAKRSLFADPQLRYPGGESSEEARQRGTAVLRGLLLRHRGSRLALGTHGDIMTLMLGAWDPAYGFRFWQSTSMPDIYKAEFMEDAAGPCLYAVTRLWRGPGA
ncbi:histidine phosphatase family protein [Paenibacillus mucilaginosus]|uniref:Phosphoglycerate mutase n=3 Tax=Paenibacillus mucilaginosus TaxID=61624 RepID=H6NRK1_9BACL|nr:histidine phosphatase family protein [Paenibacillus mucilaginosus]AEI38978.1 Phosphoglycerate mutase [Paenibacillus mucilaginosus KNP414]AFC27283.1 phosphoglycerate mutase [Paenibacillus mucilaginosus 3016]AFH59424.1 phosphoglycerate kinase [Paenibacillus mucilaginosus K02]MCG7216597.1 histidine phosphatase family protein [Paenibacillus mucilaginosus]WDM28021.1 histidine phosphatase family protein [Paenibacillus mucilaginosus]